MPRPTSRAVDPIELELQGAEGEREFEFRALKPPFTRSVSTLSAFSKFATGALFPTPPVELLYTVGSGFPPSTVWRVRHRSVLSNTRNRFASASGGKAIMARDSSAFEGLLVDLFGTLVPAGPQEDRARASARNGSSPRREPRKIREGLGGEPC